MISRKIEKFSKSGKMNDLAWKSHKIGKIKSVRISSKCIRIDANCQGEHFCGKVRLMKMPLEKVSGFSVSGPGGEGGGGKRKKKVKVTGFRRKVYHSMRTVKANNFVVRLNSWKCLWKKFRGFLIFEKNWKNSLSQGKWMILAWKIKFFLSHIFVIYMF